MRSSSGFVGRSFAGFVVGSCKFSDAVFNEEVVPLEELADVGSVDTLGVEIGHHGCEIIAEIANGLDVDRSGLIFLFEQLEHFGERTVAVDGVDGYVTEGADSVAGIGGDTFASGDVFDDEHVLALIDKAE